MRRELSGPRKTKIFPRTLHDVLAPRLILGRLGERERELEHLLPHAWPRRPDDTPAVPMPVILDCDPGHDDAIALLLALASPELELLGVTTTYGNQTLEKTTANALRVLELVGRTDVPVAAGADRPLERELVVAAHVHGESGLDGPALPEAATRPLTEDAVSFLADGSAARASP